MSALPAANRFTPRNPGSGSEMFFQQLPQLGVFPDPMFAPTRKTISAK